MDWARGRVSTRFDSKGTPPIMWFQQGNGSCYNLFHMINFDQNCRKEFKCSIGISWIKHVVLISHLEKIVNRCYIF